ncbi:MAG: hypothetical protein CL777_01685 [Chloroflexi bacterium]|nr:hypothetical protein [Chloroflexota bacterium]
MSLPKTWVENYADMSHGRTRYWEAGSGFPTVLIHGAGWTSGCETWVRNIGPLSASLHVYAIDCLNWGLGDIFLQDFSFAYLVDHVREFLDVMGIEKANFIGHSMGGWIVTLLSYESPERVNKVINVAGGGTSTRPLQSMVEFNVPTEVQIREQFIHRFPEGTVEIDELVATFVKKNALPGHGEAFAGVMRHMTNPDTRLRYNTLRRMPLIKAPTLVCWGTDDQVNDYEMGKLTASSIPGARLETFEGIGHMLPQQSAEEFNKTALEFFTT